jgi:hypothetical protein
MAPGLGRRFAFLASRTGATTRLQNPDRKRVDTALGKR